MWYTVWHFRRNAFVFSVKLFSLQLFVCDTRKFSILKFFNGIVFPTVLTYSNKYQIDLLKCWNTETVHFCLCHQHEKISKHFQFFLGGGDETGLRLFSAIKAGRWFVWKYYTERAPNGCTYVAGKMLKNVLNPSPYSCHIACLRNFVDILRYF